MKILILNGPNLNRLGLRKPEVYGSKSMAQILLEIQQIWPDVHFTYKQSNHEGDLIDWIQEANGLVDERISGLVDERISGLVDERISGLVDERISGIILNAGGYSHTSVALRDAVEECNVPVVEIHISDIRTREPFRQVSLLTDVCAHNIIGKGTDGYKLGVEWILNTLKS